MIGAVNISEGQLSGVQMGFFNQIAKNMNGAQFGFVNMAPENLTGAAFGMVNFHRVVDGMQVGFINIAQRYKGGVPIGAFTWIREGGYQAVEVSSDIFHPYNVAIKTGLGAGVGSIIDMGNGGWFFNPEVNFVSTFSKKSESFVSAYPNVGFRLGSNISLVASPSVTWQFVQKGQTLLEPVYSLYKNELDSRNALYLGVHFGVRYAINQ